MLACILRRYPVVTLGRCGVPVSGCWSFRSGGLFRRGRVRQRPPRYSIAPRREYARFLIFSQALLGPARSSAPALQRERIDRAPWLRTFRRQGVASHAQSNARWMQRRLYVESRDKAYDRRRQPGWPRMEMMWLQFLRSSNNENRARRSSWWTITATRLSR